MTDKHEARRAYATFAVKSYDDEKGIITGIASTPTPDRGDDVVVPDGVKMSLPLPLLWQHDHDQPIGSVTEAKVTKAGIEIVAEVARGVSDEIDRCWKLIKAGLVRGFSIGFRGLDADPIDGSWGLKFNEWELLEVSAVTIPMNAECTIATVKSFAGKPVPDDRLDMELRSLTGDGRQQSDCKVKFDNIKNFGEIPDQPSAAFGTKGKTPSGVTEKFKPVSLRKGNQMNYAEQIAAFEAKRAANVARMEEIQKDASDRGESKTEAEREEFDELKGEIKTIDAELIDLRDMQAVSKANAKPAEGKKSEDGTQSRSGMAPAKVKRQENLDPGIAFARIAKVKALSYLDQDSKTDVAKRYYGEDSSTYGHFAKANVVAGASVSGNWGEFLVGDETSAYADFAEYLRPMTILGKFGNGGIPSLRTVPFRVALLSQTSGGAGYWVGEGKPKPLTAFAGSRTTLDELKVASIAVATEELLRKSSPSADAMLRDQLAAAVTERIDTDFIDPAKAASAGVSPASITNGVTAINSTGNTADDIREDVRLLVNTFIAANNPPMTGVWVMSSATALALSLLQNPLGQDEFPQVTMAGGTFQGMPVITSQYLGDVSAGGYVALVNASDIYFADEGGVMVDVSREASLQMLDNPTNDTVTPTATSMVSMWQTNSVAFRAERILNWAKRRTSAVALLDSVAWGQPAA